MKKFDLKKFEKKIKLRILRLEDYDQLVELEKLCFPKMLPWKKEQVASQLKYFPEGQMVIFYDGKLVASASSVIIDFNEYEEGHSWTEIADGGYIRNHDPQGDTLYGLEIMVHPDYRGMKLARRLYEARKNLCQQKNLRRMIVGGRIPGYEKYQKKLSARQYVEKVINKEIYDPVLTTQLSNGFIIKRLIQNYLPADQDSGAWATFLEWVNIDYQPSSKKHASQSARPVRISVVQYQMRSISSFEDFAEHVEYFVDVASGYKSDFVLFPEMLTHQLLSFIKIKSPSEAVRKLSEYTQSYLDTFSSLAVKYNINIIGGSHFTVEEDSLFNIAYLFKRNGEIGKQYKLHITPNEKRWWGVQPGKRLEVFDTDKGKISIQICYDVEFPELSRLAVEKGARIIFVPFCTDERHGYLRVRYCAQARCIENQVYTAISGSTGNLPFVENLDIHYAQSGIFTPSDFPFARDGIAAECTPNVETVVIHDVDLDVLERSRQSGTVLNWSDRRPDLYQLNSPLS
ncbi:MAG: GNAT family N-acetyltransferase [Deltaproteobacteria bacterium]|nr:GNAT family N-acetyltransferase [Deltaproteobacteria bacterium]